MKRVALFLPLVLGCAGAGNFDKLSKSDQDRFARCMTPTQPVRCGSDTDLVYVTICNRGSQSQYADLASSQARMEWLVANGCPPSMVQPERFVQAVPASAASPAPAQSAQ